jgi:hypothetical protein
MAPIGVQVSRPPADTRNAPPVQTTGGAFDRIRGAAQLPAIVRECLVRFGHAVRVFLLLHGIALAL